MPYTVPINITNMQEIRDNWETYKKILLEDGLLVFRNAHLHLEEQKQLQEFIGTMLNCYPNEADTDDLHYIETHSGLKEARKADINFHESPKEILLNWHIEHANFDNALVLGV